MVPSPSWDVVDDVTTRPSLEIVGGEVLRIDLEIDRGPDVACEHERHHRSITIGVGQAIRGAVEPRPEGTSTEPMGECSTAADDVRHEESTVLGSLDLEVVDVSAEHTVSIAQLAIEEIERAMKCPGWDVHAPPFVMMMSGMVTTATTTSRTR